MKKSILIVFFVLGLSGTASAANGYPSFGFMQEMAGVVAKGSLRADLYDTLSSPVDIRFGAFDGEIMIDTANAGNFERGIGYKMAIAKNMAVYGMLYIDTTTGSSNTNLTAGVAYSGTSGDLLYNANAELFNCSACVGGSSESFINLRAAGFYSLGNSKANNKMSVGAEIDLQMSPSPSATDIYVGLRWEPKNTITMDFGLLYNDGAASTSTVATPAFARLNVGF